MKFSSALSLALAGTVMAGGAADTVNQVLNDISTALKNFDAAIKAYTGGDSKSVLDAANKIQALTEGGASKISSGADLTLNDALSITTNVQGLQAILDTALTDLEGIATKLATAGQCGTVTSSLVSQGTAAQKLQDAITSKAPSDTKPIAQQLGGKIGASIENTQAKFKEVCGSAPPSGSSSGGSSSGGSMGGAHSSGHAGSGSPTSTGKPAAKPAASSSIPKPATFTAGGSRLSACGMLAAGAAILAL